MILMLSIKGDIMIIKDNKIWWLNTLKTLHLMKCKYQFVEMMQKDAKIFELYATFTMAVVLSSKANMKFWKIFFTLKWKSFKKRNSLLGKALLNSWLIWRKRYIKIQKAKMLIIEFMISILAIMIFNFMMAMMFMMAKLCLLI